MFVSSVRIISLNSACSLEHSDSLQHAHWSELVLVTARGYLVIRLTAAFTSLKNNKNYLFETNIKYCEICCHSETNVNRAEELTNTKWHDDMTTILVNKSELQDIKVLVCLFDRSNETVVNEVQVLCYWHFLQSAYGADGVQQRQTRPLKLHPAWHYQTLSASPCWYSAAAGRWQITLSHS